MKTGEILSSWEQVSISPILHRVTIDHVWVTDVAMQQVLRLKNGTRRFSRIEIPE